MPTLGHALPGVQTIGTLNGNFIHASLFFASEDGVLTSFTINQIGNTGTEIQSVRAVAYRNVLAGSVNTPTSLMCATSAGGGVGDTLLPPGLPLTSLTWPTTLPTTPAFSSGDGIWLGLHFGPTGGNASYTAGADGIGTTLVHSDFFGDGASATWAGTSTQPTYELAISASYIVTSGTNVGVTQILDYSYAGLGY